MSEIFFNLKAHHSPEKPVSATTLFKGEGTAQSLQVLEGKLLKGHITKIPTMLICVQGEVVFENEEGLKKSLLSGSYINIKPMIKHWVKGVSDSQLLLLK